MEGVVLEMGRVQMFTIVFIASIVSDYSFEVVHGEEVGIVVGGGLKSD